MYHELRKRALGPVDEFGPDANCDDLDEAKEVPGGFLVSRSNATPVLEPIEEALDAITQRVLVAWDEALKLAVSLGREERIGTMRARLAANAVVVVALVAEHLARPRIGMSHDVIEGLGFVVLARRDHEVERAALRVDPGVDFR
jgi:hypothetical protein